MDFEQNPFSTIPQTWRYVLRVDGVTNEDLTRGIEAAKQVLEAAGLDPLKGYSAYKMLSLQWHDIVESGVPLNELQQYKEACCWADVWSDAQSAAVESACQALPNGAIAFWFGLDLPQAGPLDKQTFFKTNARPQKDMEARNRFNGAVLKALRQEPPGWRREHRRRAN